MYHGETTRYCTPFLRRVDLTCKSKVLMNGMSAGGRKKGIDGGRLEPSAAAAKENSEAPSEVAVVPSFLRDQVRVFPSCFLRDQVGAFPSC